jgi:HEPN domain-containing protein
MDEKSVIEYWAAASARDMETADVNAALSIGIIEKRRADLLYKNKRYHYSLFFCHLSVEKILKAVIIKMTKKAPPLIHDLVRLAEKGKLSLGAARKNDLAELTTFNIEARYDDYKLSFYKRADKQFCDKYMKKTKRLLKWLNKIV